MINTAQRDNSQRRHIHRMRLHPYEAIAKSTLPTQAARRMGTGSLSAFPYSTKGVGEPNATSTERSSSGRRHVTVGTPAAAVRYIRSCNLSKTLMNISLLCLVLYCLLTGCGTPDTAGTGIQAEAQGTSGTQKDVDEAQESQEGDTPMPTYTYTTKEQWVQNGDMRIYGVAYIPDTSEKSPLVIFSHELGNDHTSGERYAERLAEAGYATYVFDFCGGTVGGNKSDGSNKEMSILTEASDLEAVLEDAKTWDFVDSNRIVLLGGSMGGLVTTVVGSTHQDEIAGMLLMYPALSAKADSNMEHYATEDDVPDDVSLFGGWIHVGKNYITDLWKVDFDQLLSSYRGHMLLLHGDKDGTVPLSWSEDAKEIIPDCEFHVIKDGGHEFFGQPFEDALSYILPYLNTQLHGEEANS